MTNNVEILVEEPSCEQLLTHILPAVIPGVAFEIRTFNGKSALLKKLPQRLRGYAPWIRGVGCKLVVLVDRDDDDCEELKERLEAMARDVGLVSASVAVGEQSFDVLNRIAVEELEAWMFGDVPALRAAYPRLPKSLGSRARYRDPDAISGGTAEALEHVLQRRGYHSAGLGKVINADLVGRHMDVERNTSVSFQQFRDGLRRLVTSEDGERAT